MRIAPKKEPPGSLRNSLPQRIRWGINRRRSISPMFATSPGLPARRLTVPRRRRRRIGRTEPTDGPEWTIRGIGCSRWETA
jgi:hypothetical protein